MLKKLRITNNRTEYVLFIIAIIVSLLYIFTIAQSDMRTIANWGYDLLESIKLGALSEFPAYTNDLRQMPSNYTMLANMTTAAWLSPLYIIQNIVGSTFPMEIYWLWYKCLIGIIHFVNVYLIGKVLSKLNVASRNINIIRILYMLSTIVLVTVIGQGQIDMICLLFVLLGYHYLINGKYMLMALMFGISLIFKPFALLMVVPVLILLSAKLKGRTLLSALITALPYGINVLATKLIMPEYDRYVNLVNEQSKEIMGSNRIEEIFALRINSILVFFAAMLILCFICYYRSWHNGIKITDYIILPTLGFMMYALFVSPAAYWFIIIIPSLYLMGQFFEKRYEFYLLNLGINIGCMINVYFSEKQYSPSPELSVIGYITGHEQSQFLYRVFDSDIITYIQFISCTLFVVCALIIIGMFIYKLHKDKSDMRDIQCIQKGVNTNTYTRTDNAWLIIQAAPALVYLGFSYIQYFM